MYSYILERIHLELYFVHGSLEDALVEAVVEYAARVVRPQELAQNGRDRMLHVRGRRLAKCAGLLLFFQLGTRPAALMFLW